MNALVFSEKGKAEDVLKYSQTALGTAQPNEITIKTIASPINPNDFMFIEKQYRVIPTFPQIAGFEGCGIVTDNNGNVEIPLGALVAFRHKNVWAEQVNVPVDKVVVLPENFPVEKAAQLSLNPLTAWALVEDSGAAANEWIILSAATSAVSKLIIQFARQKAIKTIALIRNEEQAEELKSLGAHAVITDTNAGNLDKQIAAIVNNETVRCFIDAVGGELATKIIPCISANGKVICYGLLSNNNVCYHNADIIFKLITITGFGLDNWIAHKSKAELDNIWKQIISRISQEDFKMNIAGKYFLRDYKKAITESRTATKGKVLFYFNKN